MIKFKKISYKNFKSVGNSPVEIDFTVSDTTLITGKNGSGKSTLTSAISFALFGQDFVLTKPGLINSINQKQLEVTIEFETGNKAYKIVRGIKPNIFKIFENGKLLNEESNVRDYQKILETQILKMDIRAFKQVVVVGGRNYVPFMKLKTAERREFIEDLLDIRIFSIMGVLLKEKAKQLREEVRDKNEELKTIKEKFILQESFVKKLTNEKDLSVHKIEAEIGELEQENESLVALIDDYNKKYELLSGKLVIADLASMKAANVQERNSLRTRMDKLAKQIAFYENTTQCPTCTQDISQTHRDNIVGNTNEEIEGLKSQVESLEETMTGLQEQIEMNNKVQTALSKIQSAISDAQSKMNFNLQMIRSYRKQIDDLNSDDSSIEVERGKLKVFATQYKEVEKEKRALMDDQQYQVFVQDVLTDDGIKARIIKQYIPTINRLINKYLMDMNFFVSFNLDEGFNEVIKSRHRDTFRYENFSDGQQAKIDLALMFAWRDIAKMRNAVNTNILFLDEADAAVDSDGAGLLSDLLQSIKDSNVFVISHKGDVLHDKFDRVLTFDLQDNFTILKQNQ